MVDTTVTFCLPVPINTCTECKHIHFEVSIIKVLALHFSCLCRCSRWEWGLWDGVGVRYLPASRWLRLLLSRRMGAASIFQLALSGNPLNWIFTGPMFSACVSPLKSTFLLLVETGQRFFSLIHSLSALSSNGTVIDYVIVRRECKVTQLSREQWRRINEWA